jgi:hypothetical protein
MIRLLSVRLSAFPIALACVAGGYGMPALAQTAPAATTAPSTPAAQSDVRQLTDEERLAILDGNTIESAARARGEAPDAQGATRGIHGEVGMAVGTNGMRAIYGTADIPLGDHAGATVSFESSRFGGYRR